MTDGLNRVLTEARRDFGTGSAGHVDWDALDERLFARIDEERRAERRSLAPSRGRTWSGVIAGLSAVAAVALAAGGMRERRALELDHGTAVGGAGVVVAIEGPGELLVGGRRASVGSAIHLGDVLESRAERVTLGRPGKLTLVLERGASATVKHVQGSLVLALARGAIEAQVVPVASGEALAIDVGPSRVAVHGTHFRIARNEQRVVVDLTEGVVSVGEAPRVGATLGGLVTAPAHAEFFAADAKGTLVVSHEAGAVRAPATLESTVHVETTVAPSPPFVSPSKVESSETPPPAAGGVPRIEPRLQAIASSAGTSATAAPDPNAEAVIAGAVRGCMAEGLHADDVTVVVSTTLYLQLNDDGTVRIARFEPPVAPDVNACAAQAIYSTRFGHGGGAAIPVSFKN